jgi:hypothetical protein
MGGVSLYKMDGNRLDDLVCVRHSSKWGMSYVFCWCKAVFFEPRLRADLYWEPPWNCNEDVRFGDWICWLSILSDHFIEGISQNFIFILNVSGISGILDYSASSSAEESFYWFNGQMHVALWGFFPEGVCKGRVIQIQKMS